MSATEYDDDHEIDEDELLDEIEALIPRDFFRDYPHRRTRQTVAMLDYINHLKDERRHSTPVFSSISGNSSRQEALGALKRVVPERCFKDVGIDQGKKRVDYTRDRIYVLLAAQAYLSELVPQEDHHDLISSGTPEAQKLPDLDYPVHDLCDITAARFIDTPIDRLALNVREAQKFAREQDDRIARLEQTVMEQRRAIERQGQAVGDAGVLRAMMTAAVGHKVVETALRLVREGRSVEDVVTEVLQKTAHGRYEGHMTSLLQDQRQ